MTRHESVEVLVLSNLHHPIASNNSGSDLHAGERAGGAMSVLIVTQEDKARIKEIIADARKNYISFSVLQLGAVSIDKPTLSLDERVPGFERPDSQFIILGSYHVAFSFEEQPVGICRHLSVSVERQGKVPSELAVHMIAQEFDFEYGGWPPTSGKVQIWLEEFKPGQHAVNLVEVAEPAIAPKDLN